MTNSLSIPLTALVDGVEIPSYAYPGDAGMDLRSIESLEIKPFERILVFDRNRHCHSGRIRRLRSAA